MYRPGLLVFLLPTFLWSETKVRFHAADREDKPLVSDLVAFRLHPDGGLIATQWISGVRAGFKPLFPVLSDDIAEGGPELNLTGEEKNKDSSVDDLLTDLRDKAEGGKEERKLRPVDVVDEIYRGIKLSDGRVVGPRRSRVSEGLLAVSGSVVIEPSGVVPKGDLVEVPCLPVTFTATRDGSLSPFIPRLSFSGRDLLDDCLFEHSPEMPLGDVSGMVANSGDFGWLKATRGGNRLFRQLTIYLPASSKPYRFNGRGFFVTPRGVNLPEKEGLEKLSPFHLNLKLPSSPQPKPPDPVLARADRVFLSIPRLSDVEGKVAGKLIEGDFRGVDPDRSHGVSLKRASGDEFVFSLPSGIKPGLCKLEVPSLDPLPVIVGADRFKGSVSIFTRHNRCDYLRGETVHLAVILRGLNDATGSLVLRHESGEELKVEAEPGHFHRIDTSALRLGRYDVSFETSGDLLVYSTWFTVFPARPQTDFALFSWMTESFSGPILVGSKPVANVVLSQKPSRFLAPSLLARLAKQPAYPISMANRFSSHPLYPAPETAERYDPETEREAAIAMRLGMRYCPDYGWGMNGQEAQWNPKHTLPEDLARIGRLCTQVTQRHREFGNFSGLHLNWFPRLNGYWEQHPPTDGNAEPRRKMLDEEVARFEGLEAFKYRIGAHARAHAAWTRRASTLTPTFSGSPIYSSFVPVSWFRRPECHPSSYFASLPVATIHCYTDYGFSPFQPLWGLDHWGAGLGDKPRWVSTMSNGRDIMLRHAFLLAGRGADGIDLKGQDDAAATVIHDFFTRYGSFFRVLEPRSEVAILTSLNQSWNKELYGRWMGYTGGEVYRFFTKLWYARRPPAMIEDADVSLEELRKYRAVFLFGKNHLVSDDLLKQYEVEGGKVFRNPAPEETVDSRWDTTKYKGTRDAHFVGVQAAYERAASGMEKLLEELPQPMVDADTHEVMLATLDGKDVSVVFAVNDRRVPPGIYHPEWNFWGAKVLAASHTLTFDKPYFIYDLMNPGKVIRPTLDQGGRYALRVSFERGAGRAFLVSQKPLGKLHLETVAETEGGSIPLSVRVEGVSSPLPCSIEVLDDQGRVARKLYRALGESRVTIPRSARAGVWKLRVTELASGLAATAAIRKLEGEALEAQPTSALMRYPSEVASFLSKPGPARILLDRRQGVEVHKLAEFLRTRIDRPVEIEVVGDLDVHALPLRWRRNAVDTANLKAARLRKRILKATDRISYLHHENGRLDVLNPKCGWQEPGARYRIYGDVILLGTPRTNRFLEDLRKTIRCRGSQPTVRVVQDAFVSSFDCLGIEANDPEALRKAIEVALNAKPSGPAPANVDRKLQTVSSEARSPSLSPFSDSLGANVIPLAELDDGSLFVSASTDAANYFIIEEDGSISTKWLGKHGVRMDPDGKGMWLDTFWGSPGYVDSVARVDSSRSPLWRMSMPRFKKSYSDWRHPGKRILHDPSTGDLFVCGHLKVSRINAEGKVVWQYDDSGSCNDLASFRFSRDFMIHDVSPSGRHLLVAAFGIEPYGRIASKLHRSSVFLFDSHTGEILLEKKGIVIDHSVCRFLDDGRIALGDSGEVSDRGGEPKRFLILDLSGRIVYSMKRLNGTSEAYLADDWLILRPEAPRGDNRRTIGRPEGFFAVKVDGSEERNFSLSGPVHSHQFDRRLFIATEDGWVRCFEPDATLVWERRLGSLCNLLIGQQLHVGTHAGRILTLDRATGETLRDTDLMPHNVVNDVATYVRDYTKVPDKAKVLSPTPDLPPRIHRRCGDEVKFEAKPTREFVAKSGTYLVSFLQRGSTQETIELSVFSAGKSIYRARVNTSPDWRERNAAFRLAKDGRIRIDVASDAAQVKDLNVYRLSFASKNLLLQEEPKLEEFDLKREKIKRHGIRSTAKFFMPNDVSLTARARGEAPFSAVVSRSLPFDGILRGQKTSWLGKPVNGSTHVLMEVSFNEPAELSSLALFGDVDVPDGLPKTFAILCRKADTREWFQAGVEFEAASPFHLFSFDRTFVDSITYVQLSSQDGHARIAELEGYGPETDLLGEF